MKQRGQKSSNFGIRTYLTQSGHFHIVKYLTDEQGCNPSCLDEYKYAPLHHAAMSGHIDIVKFLTVEKYCDFEILIRTLLFTWQQVKVI